MRLRTVACPGLSNIFGCRTYAATDQDNAVLDVARAIYLGGRADGARGLDVVAHVIQNRCRHHTFPSEAQSVILADPNGSGPDQFAFLRQNGGWCEPQSTIQRQLLSQARRLAAKLVLPPHRLSSSDPTNGALYFDPNRPASLHSSTGPVGAVLGPGSCANAAGSADAPGVGVGGPPPAQRCALGRRAANPSPEASDPQSEDDVGTSEPQRPQLPPKSCQPFSFLRDRGIAGAGVSSKRSSEASSAPLSSSSREGSGADSAASAGPSSTSSPANGPQAVPMAAQDSGASSSGRASPVPAPPPMNAGPRFGFGREQPPLSAGSSSASLPPRAGPAEAPSSFSHAMPPPPVPISLHQHHAERPGSAGLSSMSARRMNRAMMRGQGSGQFSSRAMMGIRRSPSGDDDGYHDLILPCGLFQDEVIDIMYRELNPEDFEMLNKLDDGLPKRNIVHRNLVDRLPRMAAKDSGCSECGVCLAELEPAARVLQLPCQHAFHATCISRWLTQCKNTCPLCFKLIDPVAAAQGISSHEEHHGRDVLRPHHYEVPRGSLHATL